MIKQLTPFRPANNTEENIFKQQFCNRCVHDDGFSFYGSPGCCTILADATVYRIDDDGYPSNTWVYLNSKPTCLAFRERPGDGDDAPPYVSLDPMQLDFFHTQHELHAQ